MKRYPYGDDDIERAEGSFWETEKEETDEYGNKKKKRKEWWWQQ